MKTIRNPRLAIVLFLVLSFTFFQCAEDTSKDTPKDNPTYTVTFNTNGGNTITNRTVNKDEKVVKPTDPEKDGYTFVDWYTDEATTLAYDFTTATVTANLTLYAKWTADAVETFTVTFHTDEGSPVESLTVNKDATISQPEDPRKSNYIFAGWYTDEATTLAYDFATPVTANRTLYAKWVLDISSDIVFAPLTDTTKTIIGMREFLLTITYNNLTEKDSLVFIVGESAEAPAWSDVENHPAKITRAFTPEKNIREVYLTFTTGLIRNNLNDAGTGLSTTYKVDFSNDTGGKEGEAAYTRREAPGFMIPGETYYVHVYSGGSRIKSQTLTTLDYPTEATAYATPEAAGDDPKTDFSIAPYLWGSAMWSGRSVEVRVGELALYPARLVYPVDVTLSSSPSCPSHAGTIIGNLKQKSRDNGTQTLQPFTLTTSGGVIEKYNNTISGFANSAHLPAGRTQILDLMASLSIKEDMEEYYLIFVPQCFNAIGLPDIIDNTASEMTFKVVVE